jgi:hypothetical protein
VFGPALSYSQWNFESDPSWSETSIGIGVSSFTGDVIGIYTVEQFGIGLGAGIGTVPQDMADYDLKFSVDCIFGVGYRMALGDAFSMILGGGLYFGTFAFIPKEYTNQMMGGAMPIGPGLALTASYQLMKGVSVSALAGAAYSLMNILPLGSVPAYANGLHGFGGVGIGITY